MAAAEPLRMTWELESPGDPAAVWSVFSDTETYNRLVGFGYTFEDQAQPDGTVQRTGRTRVFGMTLVWDEMPFEYRQNQWYRIRRRFRSGPATDLVVTLRLAPKGTGTRIRYTIELTPRNFLSRPVLRFELNSTTKKQTDAGLKTLLDQVALPKPFFGPPPTPLTGGAEAALAQRLAGHSDAPFAEKLNEHLRSSPVHLQDRIHPLELAEAWAMPADTVVSGFLEAARLGVVELQWDLLCSLCQGAKQRSRRLQAGKVEVHCTSCNISFDGTFSDAVAVSFRPAEDIRRVSQGAACIGSPSNQPHVVAQDNIPPGKEVTLSLELSLGGYRVRTLPPGATARLAVGAGEGPGATLELAQGSIEPAEVATAPGQVVLQVHNKGDRPCTVVLDRRQRAEHLLTAGMVLSMPGVRERLPDGALDPSLDVECSDGVAVAVASVRSQEVTVPSGAFVGADHRVGSDRVVACFADEGAALEALSPLLGRADLRFALAEGTIVRCRLGGSDSAPDLFGPAFDKLGALLSAVPRGGLASTRAPGVAGWSSRPSPGAPGVLLWSRSR